MFCDVYSNSGGEYGGNALDPDLGVIVGENANGDPCDAFHNISMDPYYVDAANGDYHLTYGSPCIDAGDPDSPPDPDNTVADIGAFPFSHGPAILVTAPTAGTVLMRGDSFDITWNDNITEMVSIELHQGGNLVEVLTDGTESDGVYEWDITEDGPVGDDFTIVITSTTDPGVTDSSDEFTLDEPPLLILELVADDTLIVPQGGSFEYGVILESNLATTHIGDLWTEVDLVSGYTYGPIWLLSDISVGPNTSLVAEGIGQAIPATAAPGYYTFRIEIGYFPSYFVFSDEITIEVTEVPVAGISGSEPVDDWHAWGYQDAFKLNIAAIVDTELPDEYSMSPAYPNPFNPTTTVSVSLPETARLKVSVLNILGRKVAELADGSFSAGEHNIVFDATRLGSGLYFIHATVPGHLDQVQKVMLVR